MRYLSLSLLLLAAVGCTPDTPADGTAAAANANQPSPAEQKELERDRLQKPEEVIAMMGNDLTGVTVADLFADDGYFTFRLIDAGANVIAVVNDAAKAEAIEAKKKALGLGDDRLKVRTVAVGDPGLAKEEVDMALIVHGFADLADKSTYFARMREGMRYPRPLIMVEWRHSDAPTGNVPGNGMREEEVMDFIGTTGYSDVGAHSAKIPDQVIYVINDYMDLGGEPAAQ